MDLGLGNKVAVVAGGSRGCGRAISEVLAAEGACVLLSGRQGGRLLNIGSIAMKTPHLDDPMPATNTRIAVAALAAFLTGETIRLDGGYTKSLF